jgi:hypothetical protein
MITTGPPEAVGNFAAPLPSSLDEDPDTIQPASDSPETAVTSANRVCWFLEPDQSCTKILKSMYVQENLETDNKIHIFNYYIAKEKYH